MKQVAIAIDRIKSFKLRTVRWPHWTAPWAYRRSLWKAEHWSLHCATGFCRFRHVCKCMCVRVSGVVVRGCIVLLGTASIHIENESDGCLDCYSPGKNPCLTCYLKPPTGKFREGRPGRAGSGLKKMTPALSHALFLLKQEKEMTGIFDDTPCKSDFGAIFHGLQLGSHYIDRLGQIPFTREKKRLWFAFHSATGLDNNSIVRSGRPWIVIKRLSWR